MALQVHDIVDDKFRILRSIGSGGGGTVFEAEHLTVHRRVAIKVLHDGRGWSPESAERFRREARAAGMVGSERIAAVWDVGTLRDGQAYMVMELLVGESLHQRLHRCGGRLSATQLVPIVIDMLDGLIAAHRTGIVHRDLKPGNVFLCETGEDHGPFVKILDFGISKFSDAQDKITRQGIPLGTPFFMAPEQAVRADAADHRADIYAVGAMLFRGLTGRNVHLTDRLGDLLQLMVTTDAPHVSDVDPDVDRELGDIVGRALMRDREHRHPTAEALKNDLAHWLNRKRRSSAPPRPPHGPPTGLLALGTGALVAACTLGAVHMVTHTDVAMSVPTTRGPQLAGAYASDPGPPPSASSSGPTARPSVSPPTRRAHERVPRPPPRRRTTPPRRPGVPKGIPSPWPPRRPPAP